MLPRILPMKEMYADRAYVIDVGWCRVGGRFSSYYEKTGSGVALATGWDGSWTPKIIPASHVISLWSDYKISSENIRKQKEEMIAKQIEKENVLKERKQKIFASLTNLGIKQFYDFEDVYDRNRIQISCEALENLIKNFKPEA